MDISILTNMGAIAPSSEVLAHHLGDFPHLLSPLCPSLCSSAWPCCPPPASVWCLEGSFPFLCVSCFREEPALSSGINYSGIPPLILFIFDGIYFLSDFHTWPECLHKGGFLMRIRPNGRLKTTTWAPIRLPSKSNLSHQSRYSLLHSFDLFVN